MAISLHVVMLYCEGDLINVVWMDKAFLEEGRNIPKIWDAC